MSELLLNCRKFTYWFTFATSELGIFLNFFYRTVLLLSHSKSTDMRWISWPDKALCWSFMLKWVEEDAGWLLCVCHSGLSCCVTWTLHNYEACGMKTLSLSVTLFCSSWKSSWMSLKCPPPWCHFYRASVSDYPDSLFFSLSVFHPVSSLSPPRTFLCLLWQQCRDSCQHFSAAGQRLSSSVPLIYSAVCCTVCEWTRRVYMHVPCVDADVLAPTSREI